MITIEKSAQLLLLCQDVLRFKERVEDYANQQGNPSLAPQAITYATQKVAKRSFYLEGNSIIAVKTGKSLTKENVDDLIKMAGEGNEEAARIVTSVASERFTEIVLPETLRKKLADPYQPQTMMPDSQRDTLEQTLNNWVKEEGLTCEQKEQRESLQLRVLFNYDLKSTFLTINAIVPGVHLLKKVQTLEITNVDLDKIPESYTFPPKLDTLKLINCQGSFPVEKIPRTTEVLSNGINTKFTEVQAILNDWANEDNQSEPQKAARLRLRDKIAHFRLFIHMDGKHVGILPPILHLLNDTAILALHNANLPNGDLAPREVIMTSCSSPAKLIVQGESLSLIVHRVKVDLYESTTLRKLHLYSQDDKLCSIDEKVSHLAQLAGLELGEAEANTLTPAIIEALSKLDKLTKLSLNFRDKLSQSARNILTSGKLSELKYLTKFSISYQGEYPPSTIRNLKTLPKLSRLSLSESKNISAILPEVIDLPHLRELDLRNCNLTSLPSILLNLSKDCIIDISAIQSAEPENRISEADIAHFQKAAVAVRKKDPSLGPTVRIQPSDS